MKKISLFVATLFMSLLLSVSATAQRAWAYDLALTVDGSEHTFSFKATTAAAATLVFTDAVGTELSVVELGAVNAGLNTKVLSAAELPAGQEVKWAVKMEGEAIADFEILTDASNDSYNFYLPQDVKVNNNPESEYFGTIYVAEPYAGANDGATVHTKTQTAGIYVYNAALEIENYAEGYVPGNVTIVPTDKHNTLHRLAINPLTDEVVFTQSVGAYVWAANPADLTAEATNLAADLGIEMTNSVCFDENGVMYVFDNMGTLSNGDGTTTDVGTLYKVVDGVATAVVSTSAIVNGRNSLAADGRGGVWIGQNRSQMDEYNYLTHVNAAGEIDYEVNVNSAEEVKAMFAVNMNRGHIAYDALRDVLAIGGGGKVTLLYAEYDDNGTPTLTKWTETPMLNPEKPAWNIDGLGFDYAGDLYVLCASNETFYKFAVPTDNNVCVVPAASKYAFEVTPGDDPVVPDGPEYTVYEDEITNLVIDYDNMLLTGGPSTNYGVEVTLGLGDYDMNTGIFQLNPESMVSVQGSDATFVEGYAYVDGIDQTAQTVVKVVWNEMYIEFHLTMSAAPLEATVVVVENATVEVEKVLLFGDMYDYALKMTGVWTNEGVDYPVLVEVPVYYPEATEPSTIYSTVTVGGMGDDDPWFGFGEGDLTITTVDGVVTAQGVVSNPGVGLAIDITISGKLSADTALDNVQMGVKAVKAVKNGQLVITIDNVDYNATGAVVK